MNCRALDRSYKMTRFSNSVPIQILRQVMTSRKYNLPPKAQEKNMKNMMVSDLWSASYFLLWCARARVEFINEMFAADDMFEMFNILEGFLLIVTF